MTSELRTRTMSGVILAAVAIALTAWSFTSFAIMCAVGGVILMKEWWGLTKQRSRWWVLVGVVYIGVALASLLALRFSNIWFIWYLFCVVWSGDITAYLVGRKIGKHKIAPSISPGKSWEGLFSSMIASALVSVGFSYFVSMWLKITIQSVLISSAIGIGISVVGLLGDFFESSLKRRAGVKDSGTLIPGHGGLFDRLDALLPSAIFLLVVTFIWVYFASMHMH